MSLNSRPARLYVANRRANPIVRMSGSRAVSSSARTPGASPWRANWLRRRRRANSASSRFWRRWASHRSLAGIALEALPEAALLRARVEVVEVRIELALEQVDDRGPEPGGPVDPVGQALDLVVRDAVPGAPGRLAVELAHGVRPVREAQRERRHVELVPVVVHADALGEHVLHRQAARGQDRTGDAPDEVGIEPLVAGGDRGVDREDAVASDLGPGVAPGSRRPTGTRRPARPGGMRSGPR